MRGYMLKKYDRISVVSGSCLLFLGLRKVFGLGSRIDISQGVGSQCWAARFTMGTKVKEVL